MAVSDLGRDIMREAHRQRRVSARLDLGWDWARCLRYAHHKVGGKRKSTAEQMTAIAEAIKAHELKFGAYGRGN